MGLFDRHAGLLDAYRDVRTTGADPFQIRMERVLSPTEAIIDGRKCLLVGTNNYFGLTFDPSCMEAAIEAIRNEGTGTTGSRIANGSYGWCIDCGGPVGRPRLLVQPMAVRCAPCQSKREKRIPVR